MLKTATGQCNPWPSLEVGDTRRRSSSFEAVADCILQSIHVYAEYVVSTWAEHSQQDAAQHPNLYATRQTHRGASRLVGAFIEPGSLKTLACPAMLGCEVLRYGLRYGLRNYGMHNERVSRPVKMKGPFRAVYSSFIPRTEIKSASSQAWRILILYLMLPLTPKRAAQ